MSARSKPENSVLDAIRSHLERSDRGDVQLPPVSLRADPPGDLPQRFVDESRSVGAHCTLVGGMDDARTLLTELCLSKTLRRIVRSDGKLAEELLSEQIGNVQVARSIEDRGDLFTADAGITDVQWGIAETGTLVLTSGDERHRLTSLVPPIHIALLPASSIVATMPSVLERLRQSENHHQAVTFITGPSRTADIELTLVVGVHGPKELHVVILSDQ